MFRSIGPYQVVGRVGVGAFAKVYVAEHTLTKRKVAMKEIPKDDANLATIDREISVLKSCDHPNILHLFDVIETGTHIYLVTEYASNGSVDKFTSEGAPMMCQLAFTVMTELIDAVDYLHNTLHVLHRDIKAQNILLDMNNDAILCDFGFCKQQEGGQSMFQTSCGSPAYAAPEVIMRQPYCYPADVWSMGVLFYLMIVGQFPFQTDNVLATMKLIVEEEPHFPDMIVPKLRSLLERMLDKNPDTRITVKEIKEHPWFQDLNHSKKSPLTAADEAVVRVSVMDDLMHSGYNAELLKRAEAGDTTCELWPVWKMVLHDELTRAKRRKVQARLKDLKTYFTYSTSVIAVQPKPRFPSRCMLVGRNLQSNLRNRRSIPMVATRGNMGRPCPRQRGAESLPPLEVKDEEE